MTPVLIDTNVLLNISEPSSEWRDWSAETLKHLLGVTKLVINVIVFAEVSTGFARIEDVEEFLAPDLYEREDMPFAAAFLAAKVHRDYRRRGGAKLATLPDFFIGAHAAFAGYRLLTRDAARYRTYFPTVDLITPPSA